MKKYVQQGVATEMVQIVLINDGNSQKNTEKPKINDEKSSVAKSVNAIKFALIDDF